MLIVLGQAATGEGAKDRTLALLCDEAAACETPASRAFAFLRLAILEHALGRTERERLLLARAREAAGEVESDSLKPLVDLELLTALARSGDFRAGEAIVRATRGVQARAAQYCALALAAAERRDTGASREYLRAARRLTTDQDEETVGVILLKIGQVQAAAGDYRASRLTADAMPNLRSQVEVFAEMARRQRRAGEGPGYADSIRRARELAARIPVEARLAPLILVASVQSEGGDVAGARETIATARVVMEATTDLGERVAGLLDLAAAAARAGDADGCRELLLSADAAKLKLPMPRNGEVDPFHYRSVGVITALARAGLVDTAESMARNYRAAGDRPALEWALAEARAKRGHLPDAVEHFARLTPPAYRAWAARRIAEAYASRGQFEGLERFIAGLAPGERAWADLGAAEGLIGYRITDRRNSEFCQLGVD